MNFKRAIGYGVILWIFIFVEFSIVMFLPWFKDHTTAQYVANWVLLIPIVLLCAKWYFKAEIPTTKKGLLLGIIGLIVGTILDVVITIPFFVKSYSMYYGNWLMYVGFVEGILLATFAGYEFDGTYSKRENVEAKN
ncbi:MAG: hypothetical protein WCW16_03345 [Candidatus Magasanikbacteria bacterium]